MSLVCKYKTRTISFGILPWALNGTLGALLKIFSPGGGHLNSQLRSRPSV